MVCFIDIICQLKSVEGGHSPRTNRFRQVCLCFVSFFAAHLLLLARHRLHLTLARARVGLGALPAAGQPHDVASAAVALNLLEAVDVHHVKAAEVTLNHVLVHLSAQLRELLLLKLPHALVLQSGVGHDLLRRGVADAEHVSQRGLGALVVGNLHTRHTRRANLQLPPLEAANLFFFVFGKERGRR